MEAGRLTVRVEEIRCGICEVDAGLVVSGLVVSISMLMRTSDFMFARRPRSWRGTIRCEQFSTAEKEDQLCRVSGGLRGSGSRESCGLGGAAWWVPRWLGQPARRVGALMMVRFRFGPSRQRRDAKLARAPRALRHLPPGHNSPGRHLLVVDRGPLRVESRVVAVVRRWVRCRG